MTRERSELYQNPERAKRARRRDSWLTKGLNQKGASGEASALMESDSAALVNYE